MKREQTVYGVRVKCPHCGQRQKWSQGRIAFRCKHLKRFFTGTEGTGMVFKWVEKKLTRKGLEAPRQFRMLKDIADEVVRQDIHQRVSRKRVNVLSDWEQKRIERDKVMVENFIKRQDKEKRKATDVRAKFVDTMGVGKGNDEFQRWGTRASRNARTVKIALGR